jgi:hypothetical protein
MSKVKLIENMSGFGAYKSQRMKFPSLAHRELSGRFNQQTLEAN